MNDPIDDRAELTRRIDELERTVERLEERLGGGGASSAERATVPAAGSRRDVLKLAGGAAAGVVAAGVLAGRGQPVAATTGDPFVVGGNHWAGNMTRIRNGSGATSVGPALTSESTMFWADNRLSTINANGIRGDGQGVSGAGVWGHSDSNGIGLLGSGGIGVQASGGRAALYLTGTSAAPPARSDAHLRGEFDIDSAGDVWLCVVAGSPGTWRKVGGPASAGAFHAVNPVRAYDSRWSGGSRIATGTQRLVSVADGHDIDTALVDAPNAVPAGSTAIAYNLTVAGTDGAGYLAVAPGTATSVTASSINWSTTGQTLANGLVVGIDASRQVRVFAGGAGSTDFLVDVVGYFR